MKQKAFKGALILSAILLLFIFDHFVFHLGPRLAHVFTTVLKIETFKKANIVMLGDSITAGADWNELLGRTDIANRGIVRDDTEGFLKRLDHVYKLRPKMCFVMGGVNDIGRLHLPVKNAYDNLKKITVELKKHNIIPVIQSTLYTQYTSAQVYVPLNLKIHELNILLKQYAQEEGIEYVDLNKVLSENNKLKDQYTDDGLHLNANGYKVWRAEILPIIKKYQFSD